MKRIIFILCVVFSLVGCQENDGPLNDYGNEKYLRTSPSGNVRLDRGGGKLNVWVESNTEWVCAIEGDFGEVDKTKGDGDDVIVVSWGGSYREPLVSKTAELTIKWKSENGYQIKKIIFNKVG